MFKRLFSFFVLSVLLLGLFQYQAVADWWALQNYQPPTQIAAFADKTAMTEHGKKLFYASHPVVLEKQGFSQHCPTTESSYVLGCYKQALLGKIYVLEVEQTEISDVMAVTAAHEMLHAGYARLPAKEKRRIDGLLEQEFNKIDDQKLRELVDEYKANQTESISNELHSLLGTQEVSLSPELETYYRQYFNDRSKVVALYLSYEGVFEDINQKIETLKQELTAMQTQLEGMRADIEEGRTSLAALQKQMDQLLRQNQIEQYNALVPVYNGRLSAQNAAIREYNRLVALYNAKSEELNRLALRQNDLVTSLDTEQLEQP